MTISIRRQATVRDEFTGELWHISKTADGIWYIAFEVSEAKPYRHCVVHDLKFLDSRLRALRALGRRSMIERVD